MQNTNHQGATQVKERLYTQLAANLGRMNRALGQTSNLSELYQVDLHSMRMFAGLDAAKLMAIASSLNPEHDTSIDEGVAEEEQGKQH